MKKMLPIFLAIVASSSFAQPYSTSSSSSSAHSKPMYSYKGKEIKIAPKPAVASSAGFVLEDRTSPYIDGYIFLNQMIYNRVFWELRGYYIHNYIVTAPPAGAVPRPHAKDELNLNGTGVLGILGYNFPLTPKLSLLPYVRVQYLTNTVSAYKDSFGNQITSNNTTYYLALKLTMVINEVLSIYANYFAGFQKSNLEGKGFFATKGKPRINSHVSSYQIGFPYKATQSWTLTPSVQLNLTGNNPNWVALNPPISSSGLTTNSLTYQFRVAYNF